MGIETVLGGNQLSKHKHSSVTLDTIKFETPAENCTDRVYDTRPGCLLGHSSVAPAHGPTKKAITKSFGLLKETVIKIKQN